MKGGVNSPPFKLFSFFKKKLLTRYLVFAITDNRKGEVPSDINREGKANEVHYANSIQNHR